MYASAARWRTAWKLAIGFPNCSRWVVYSAVMRSARSVTPSCIAQRARGRALDEPLDRVPSARDRFAGRAVEREPALDLAARGDPALDPDAPAVRVDQEERNLAIGPGRDDRARRQVCRRDARLDAVEPPRAAVAAGGRRGRRRIVGAGLGERSGEDRLARRDAGEPAPALLLRPEPGARARAQAE